jgi:hypothetical protein
MNAPKPEFRILWDHIETDQTGWVIAEVIPGLKFDTYEEARTQLRKIGGVEAQGEAA